MIPLAPISKQQEMRKILIDFIVKALGSTKSLTSELTGRRDLKSTIGNWKSAMASRSRRSGPTSCSAAR
jgi:hypothetical protein